MLNYSSKIISQEDDQYFESQIIKQKADFDRQQELKQKQSIKNYIKSIEIRNVQGIGPKSLNRWNLESKYDFKENLELTEYGGQIKLLRLLGKSANKYSITSYIGQIDGKMCCVKLISMVKIHQALKWIDRVREAQKDKTPSVEKYFQKYLFYQLQDLGDNNICNLFIISALEQYNVYWFSIDPCLSLEDKVKVAYDINKLIGQVFKIQKATREQSLIQDFYKNIDTIQPNNLLISQKQLDEETVFFIKLADWQMLLDEFKEIIPFTSKPNHYLTLNSGPLNDFVNSIAHKFLTLIFFKVNFEMQQEFKLQDFNEKTFYDDQLQEIKVILQEQDEQQRIQKLEQFICDSFKLSPIRQTPNLATIFTILMKEDIEEINIEFSDHFQGVK